MNNLRVLRTNRGMTQAQLAERVGVSQQVYSNYETGKHELYSSVILKLSRILGVTCDEIIDPRYFEKPDSK